MVLHDMLVNRPWIDHGDSAFNVEDPDHDVSDAFNLELDSPQKKTAHLGVRMPIFGNLKSLRKIFQ